MATATQEILVRVVTRLSQFDFHSRLKTWVYRVAVNYILDVKKSAVERLHLTFDQFAEDLAEGCQRTGRCTLGMLQCLDRPHRLAYVLGEILGMSGPEAADALEIAPDVFRKRLQHARTVILSFTRSYCGLASDTAACACNRRVPVALRIGRVRSDTFDFAATASSFQEARAIVRQVDEARWALEVHRTNRPRASSVDVAHRLARALDPQRD